MKKIFKDSCDLNVATRIIYTTDFNTYFYDSNGSLVIPSSEIFNLFVKGVIISKDGVYYKPVKCETNGTMSIYEKSETMDKAIICFIDDDAQTGSNSTYSMFEELGIPYGIACPVSTIGTSGHLSLSQLVERKANGADILMHGSLGSEDWKTMTLEDIKESVDTALEFMNTNGYNNKILVYPSGIQPLTNSENMTDIFNYMLSKGITYGFNVNTDGESSSKAGIEDWYTYANGQTCNGVWNLVPIVNMPNGYPKTMLLNRQQYSSNFFYKRKSYWFNNIQNVIDNKGFMCFFSHGYTLSSNVTTYDGETLTLLESYKQMIEYLIENYSDKIEIMSPIAALNKINKIN